MLAMTRLVQLTHALQGRRVAVVEDDSLRLLQSFSTVYDLAQAAIERDLRLVSLVDQAKSAEQLAYDPIYQGANEWRLLPAFDHPREPARCLVSGTGLTHKASALNRNAMHEGQAEKVPLTDSMKMFQWGLEGGRPEPGQVGVAPEWFYKGDGSIVRAHGEPLPVPVYAEDGGEEGEVAGVYLIDPAGRPRRVGLTVGNEFADHKFEKRNYLYLAHSKMRLCTIGPELVLDYHFDNVRGKGWIERNGDIIWSDAIATGEANMSHSLANLEHHHFKYEAHRRPGVVHIHFFGADTFSFGGGLTLADGDVMVIELPGFGRALRNPLHIETGTETPIRVEAL
jgi:hypothetical protein